MCYYMIITGIETNTIKNIYVLQWPKKFRFYFILTYIYFNNVICN